VLQLFLLNVHDRRSILSSTSHPSESTGSGVEIVEMRLTFVTKPGAIRIGPLLAMDNSYLSSMLSGCSSSGKAAIPPDADEVK
jgi:hypothetical protein